MSDSDRGDRREPLVEVLERAAAERHDQQAAAIRAGRLFPPPSRPSVRWVDVQQDVVEAAERAPADRERLAGLLLELIRTQPTPTRDTLESATFELLRTTLDPYRLLAAARELDRNGNTQLLRHMWCDDALGPDVLREMLPPAPGRATWLGRLQHGPTEAWSDDAWIDRLEMLAALDGGPSAVVADFLGSCDAPTAAMPAFTAAVVAHVSDAVGASDHGLWTPVRSAVGADPGRAELAIDWDACMRIRPVVFRQMLELWCEPGQRPEVIGAARQRGLISGPVAAFLAEPVPRPFWADGRDGFVAQLESHGHPVAREMARYAAAVKAGYAYATPPEPGVVRAVLAARGLVDPPAELMAFFEAQGGGIELLDGGTHGIEMAARLREHHAESSAELVRVAWPIRGGGGWSWLGAVPTDGERCAVWRFELEGPQVQVADSITELVIAARELIEASPQTPDEVLALPRGDVLDRLFGLRRAAEHRQSRDA